MKKCFANIKKKVPVSTSPFDTMREKLKRKLKSTKRSSRTKKALSPDEIKALLTWLSKDNSVQGLENYAIVFMLVTSGLRGEELCSLRWQDLEYFEGRWTAIFIGRAVSRQNRNSMGLQWKQAGGTSERRSIGILEVKIRSFGLFLPIRRNSLG